MRIDRNEDNDFVINGDIILKKELVNDIICFVKDEELYYDIEERLITREIDYDADDDIIKIIEFHHQKDTFDYNYSYWDNIDNLIDRYYESINNNN